MARVRNANCNYERACAHDILRLAIFLHEFSFPSRSSVCATIPSPVLCVHVFLLFPLGCIGSKKVTCVRAFVKSLRFSTYTRTRRLSFFLFSLFFLFESNIVDNFGQPWNLAAVMCSRAQTCERERERKGKRSTLPQKKQFRLYFAFLRGKLRKRKTTCKYVSVHEGYAS